MTWVETEDDLGIFALEILLERILKREEAFLEWITEKISFTCAHLISAQDSAFGTVLSSAGTFRTIALRGVTSKINVSELNIYFFTNLDIYSFPVFYFWSVP